MRAKKFEALCDEEKVFFNRIKSFVRTWTSEGIPAGKRYSMEPRTVRILIDEANVCEICRSPSGRELLCRLALSSGRMDPPRPLDLNMKYNMVSGACLCGKLGGG